MGSSKLVASRFQDLKNTLNPKKKDVKKKNSSNSKQKFKLNRVGRKISERMLHGALSKDEAMTVLEKHYSLDQYQSPIAGSSYKVGRSQEFRDPELK